MCAVLRLPALSLVAWLRRSSGHAGKDGIHLLAIDASGTLRDRRTLRRVIESGGKRRSDESVEGRLLTRSKVAGLRDKRFGKFDVELHGDVT